MHLPAHMGMFMLLGDCNQLHDALLVSSKGRGGTTISIDSLKRLNVKDGIAKVP